MVPMPEPTPSPLPRQDPAPPAIPNPAPTPLWRESLEAHDDVEEGVQGLGGWLFLFGIGRVIAVFVWVGALLKDLAIIGKPDLWSALTTPGTHAYSPLWSTVLLGETAGNALWLLWSVALVALFFARWKIFRPMVIGYLVGITLFFWADYLLCRQISTLSDEVRAKALLGCLTTTLTAAIWIPYFLASERVRRTFVK